MVRKPTKKCEWKDVESATDVFASILSRLPVKCLKLFKTVSKFWYELINSPSFVRLQLSWSRDHPVYIYYPYMDEMPIVYLINTNWEVIERITLSGFERISFLSMCCSHDGLVCFTNHPRVQGCYNDIVFSDLVIYMCNPATREVKLLHKGSSSEEEISFGVSFGPGIGEYKMYRFFRSKHDSKDVCPRCEIYSSTNRTWRGVDCVPDIPRGYHHVYINGKVYWFITSDENEDVPGSILTVDMEENFAIIDIPFTVDPHSFLVDLDGCLSLVCVFDEEHRVLIWVLTDCNDSGWEFKGNYEVPFSELECLDSVATLNGNLFLITTEHYFVFNLENELWEELEFEDEFEKNLPIVFPYTQSLLPCKYPC